MYAVLDSTIDSIKQSIIIQPHPTYLSTLKICGVELLHLVPSSIFWVSAPDLQCTGYSSENIFIALGRRSEMIMVFMNILNRTVNT